MNAALDEDEFLTASRVGSAVLIVKGSRFIGHALPVSSVQEAEDEIAVLSGQYPNATHNCHAYRVGTGQDVVYRFDDAGEPAGTAGCPILQAIEAKGVTNVAIVVTRYFGGRKLGAGGLVRAYSSAASAALDDARLVKRYLQETVRISLPYHFLNVVTHAAEQLGAEVVRSQFSDRVTLVLNIRSRFRQATLEALRNATAGKLKVLQ